MSSSVRNAAVRGKAGLTFLELLIAVAVSGLILTAGSQLLFSFARFWGESELEPRFNRHVDGVTSLIQYGFDRSANLAGRAGGAFGWGRPPGRSNRTFHLRLESAPPLFVTDVRPAPVVDAWIDVDEELGLSLLWHVPPALTGGKIKLHRTLLSAWVKDVEIGYHDTSRNLWEYESLGDASAGARRAAPGALRIRFEQDGRERLRDIRMNRYDRHVLIY